MNSECGFDVRSIWGWCGVNVSLIMCGWKRRKNKYKSGGGGGGGKASEMLRSKKGRKKVKKCFSPLPSLTCTICALRISEPELEMKAAAYENWPNNYGTTQ